MYLEMKRSENNFDIISNKNGQLVFYDKSGNVLTKYPDELMYKKCPLKSPLVVHLELTRRCGLKCKHCYISAGIARKNELSVIEWKRILLQLKELEVLSVYITGGDPLLYNGVLELMDYANNIGLSINLLTNGLEFDRSVNISDIPKEVFVVLSFDGINGTKILRGISGERIVKIVSNLKNHNIAFAIQGVVFRDNILELTDFFEYCLDKKIDFSFNDILPIGRTKKYLDLLVKENQISDLIKLEKKYRYYQKKYVFDNHPFVYANPNIYESIGNIVQATNRPEPGLPCGLC